MSLHRCAESAGCPARVLSGEDGEIEQGMGRVAVVLRLVVVGHPRQVFGRPGPSEHRLLRRGQPVGAHESLLGVGEAVVGGSDPYGLPCEERVRLGA